MKKIITFLVNRSIIGNLLTLIFLFAGIISLTGMRREVFPIVDLDVVSIYVIYTGASPQEVEKLIVNPIEQELKSLTGIKKQHASSLQGRASLAIILESDLSNKAKVIQDIKNAVNRAKTQFPEDVKDPIVYEQSTSLQPVIQIAISAKPGEKIPEIKLRNVADIFEDELYRLPNVAQVFFKGRRKREIFVEVDPEKLMKYNISVEEISQALAKRNLNFPGGKVSSESKEFVIRTVKEFQNIDEIKNLILRSNDLGSLIRLSDVAKVRDGFVEKRTIEKINSSEAIIVTVAKKEKGDTIDLVEDIRNKIKKLRKKVDSRVVFTELRDVAAPVQRRLDILSGNILIGLLLVSGSLFLFLGLRTALMVALGIPFSFGVAFFLMDYLGMTINLISMFGLVLVSGMIVDDAIVVGENIYRLIEKGTKPAVAAVKGTIEMLAPVTASISTTIIAFLPLAFMSGTMGKFVSIMPITVIIALLASLFESFFILPAHVADLTRGISRHKILKKESSFEYKFFQKLLSIYRPILEWAIRYRYLTLIIVGFLLMFAMMLYPRIGFILFPSGKDVEQFFIKAEAPKGVDLNEMNKRIKPFEDIVLALPRNEIKSFETRIGIHKESTMDAFVQRGENFAQIGVELTSPEERERTASDIIHELKLKIDPKLSVHSAFYVTRNGESLIAVIDNKPVLRLYKTDDVNNPVSEIRFDQGYFLAGTPGFENEVLIIHGHKKKYQLLRVNLIDEKFSKPIPLPDTLDLINLSFSSPDQKYSFFTDIKGKVYLLDHSNLKFKKIKKINGKINNILWVDKKTLLLATNDEGLLLWKFDGSDFDSLWQLKRVPNYLNKDKFQNYKKGQIKLEQILSIALPFDEKKKSSGIVFLGMNDGSILEVDYKKEKLIKSYLVSEKAIHWLYPVEKDEFWINWEESLAKINISNGNILKQKKIDGKINRSLNLKSSYSEVLVFADYQGLWKIGSKAKMLRKGNPSIKKIDFKEVTGGPPVGAPVEIKVQGEEFDTILEIIEKLKQELHFIPGVFNIHDTWIEGSEEFRVNIDDKKAAFAGISVESIAKTIQAAFDGRIATRIKRNDEKIDIRVIFSEKMRRNLESLKKVKVRNNLGNLVSITTFASFERHPGVSMITHFNHRRTVSVKANIDKSKNTAVGVQNQLKNFINKMENQHLGYTVSAAGEYEDTEKSMEDLFNSTFLAVAGILFVLILLFGNFRQPLVIISAVPLGFAGVIFAFAAHKLIFQPELTLSFMAMFGVVGLSGVVVNDSIVLVDFINKLRKTGMNMHDALVGAGLSRLRPVLLTTITTVCGLLPIAYGLGGSDSFLKPMALSMSWGLLFASLIVLIVIPTLYIVIDDLGYVFHNAWSGGRIRKFQKELKGK